jgi:hypothetical protein
VAAAALQALVSFLKKTHHAHIRWQGYKELNARLNVLAQGWGGKEEVRDWVDGVSVYLKNKLHTRACPTNP